MNVLKLAVKVLLIMGTTGTVSVLLGLNQTENEIASVLGVVACVLVVRADLARQRKA